MMIFKYFALFIIFNIFGNINAQTFPLSQPLREDQINLTTSILNLYGLANNDPCSYNLIRCYNNYDGVGLAVGEISIANIPEGKSLTLTMADLSPFAISLEYLYLSDDKVTLDDSFWSSIDQFTLLKKIRIYQQSSNIASTSFPTNLAEIVIDNYGGQVSDIFFNSELEKLVINGTLPGFSYGITQFPSNDKLKTLYLVADTNLPTGLTNLQNIAAFSLKIDNRKDLSVFTIPNEFDGFSNAYSISFLFTTDNPVFTFPSTIQNIQSLKTLFINGNGFVTPASGSSYDFTLSENIKFDLNGLSNFLSCSAKPCIKTNVNSTFSTVGSSYLTSNIDFTKYTAIYISDNSIAQELPVINYNEIKRAYFINSQFNGQIPDQYCNIAFEKYSFVNNKLTVPDCLLCASVIDQVKSILTPNSFSVPTTPCSYKKTIKRDTVGGIISIPINGNSLGFASSSTSTPRSNVIAPIITFKSINTLANIDTFPGEGSNNVYNYNFTGTQIELTVSYDAPVIVDYDFDEEDNLIIKGTGYSIINRNIVNIENSSGKSISLNVTSYDGISLSFSKNLYDSIGSRSLKVQAVVADQSSNIFEVSDPDYPSSSSTLSPILILNIIILVSLFIYF